MKRPEKSYGLPRTISDGFTWEKVTTTNLGVDARFFKDRLGLSFDLYRRRTSDMITEGEALAQFVRRLRPEDQLR